jgi:hypothetical protein
LEVDERRGGGRWHVEPPGLERPRGAGGTIPKPSWTVNHNEVYYRVWSGQGKWGRFLFGSSSDCKCLFRNHLRTDTA